MSAASLASTATGSTCGVASAAFSGVPGAASSGRAVVSVMSVPFANRRFRPGYQGLSAKNQAFVIARVFR